MLEEAELPQLYDGILIDEAQDFEQNFYRLCRAALKPPKRLVWAYDEAQDLSSPSVPEPISTFGTDENGDPIVDLRGAYEGGIQKSQIMRRAYRTPRSVLMTAHVFGMGLKREAGAVQEITNKEGWRNIGYEARSGDFRKVGEPIELARPTEYSPHPLTDVDDAQPFLQLDEFETHDDERAWLATQIQRDIGERGLEPEDILVIPIDDSIRTEGEQIADVLTERGLDVHRVWKAKSSGKHEGTSFRRSGHVTVAGVNRAKGNEAAMVYIPHIDNIADTDRRRDTAQRRNEAFVALTRTRCWCTMSGTGQSLVFDELRDIIEEVSQAESIVTFPAPNPRERESAAETTLFDWADPSSVRS